MPVEKIRSTLPLKESIRVQVLSLGLSGNKILPPKIRYSYFIPKPEIVSRRSKVRYVESNPKHFELSIAAPLHSIKHD